jgi:hypothetical protein
LMLNMLSFHSDLLPGSSVPLGFTFRLIVYIVIVVEFLSSFRIIRRSDIK